MSQAEAKRRRYQFSLRTLLIVVMVMAGLAGALHIAVEPYRLQRQAMAVITKLGGSYETQDAASWVRWLEPKAQDVVKVDLHDCDQPDEYLPYLASLPKLRTLVVAGHAFGDQQLSEVMAMPSLHLYYLDIRVTGVTDDGLVHLKQSKTLRRLRFSFTKITDKGIPHLEKLTHLDDLDLLRTDISWEGVTRLRTALPNCDIRHHD